MAEPTMPRWPATNVLGNARPFRSPYSSYRITMSAKKSVLLRNGKIGRNHLGASSRAVIAGTQPSSRGPWWRRRAASPPQRA